MFGADTPLVIDALQIAGLAAIGAAAVMLVVMKRSGKTPRRGSQSPRGDADLESRVQVLERIATDPTIELANEIEALRTGSSESPAPKREEHA
ncbi:MAG: hypothetical protein WBA51_13220 [Erythrobacter sp.]